MQKNIRPELKNLFSFKLLKISVVLSVSILALGCSKGKFEKAVQMGCDSDTGACSFDETIYISGGMVDILFVDDNSGSMSFEQSKMGERFPRLLEKLDERMLNYRIGITTTDISRAQNPPRAINQNGALQNGRLITYSNGKKYLEPNTPGKNNLFLNSMKRPETLECEQYITNAVLSGISLASTEYQRGYFNHCPSGDERGIMASVYTVRHNSDQLIRPEAHLAIVIISDENERSWGFTDSEESYILEHDDQPQTLIDTVKAKYPNKTLSVHSIVVRSNDHACLQMQNDQMGGLVKGFYGTVYEELSRATNGVIGSVCESDYGNQMGQIGAAIVDQVEYFALHCENPENLALTFIPSSAALSYHLEGRRVVFNGDLDPSSRVRFQYNCPRVN